MMLNKYCTQMVAETVCDIVFHVFSMHICCLKYDCNYQSYKLILHFYHERLIYVFLNGRNLCMIYCNFQLYTQTASKGKNYSKILINCKNRYLYLLLQCVLIRGPLIYILCYTRLYNFQTNTRMVFFHRK